MSEMSDDFDFDRYEDEQGDVTCKRCGKKPLYWFWAGSKYRLIDEKGNFHTCKPTIKGLENLDA